MTWTSVASIKGAQGATGSTASTVDASTVGPGWWPSSYVSGNYYFCNGYGATTATGYGDNNKAIVSPWTVTASITITRLFVEITTSAASTNYRIGIWNDNGYGQPGTLVLDAGTVSATSTGVKEVTVSQALSAGQYWVGGAAQGGYPYLRAPGYWQTNNPPMPLGTSLSGNFITQGYYGYTTAFSGAFSNWPTTGITLTAFTHRVGFKVS